MKYIASLLLLSISLYVAAANYTGQNTRIAILDSGIHINHNALNSRIKRQGCFNPEDDTYFRSNIKWYKEAHTCRNGFGFGYNKARIPRRAFRSSTDTVWKWGVDHGSNVAKVVNDIAPGADLEIYNIVRYFVGRSGCNLPPGQPPPLHCYGPSEEGVIDILNRLQYSDVDVVNLSFSLSSNNCNNPRLVSAVNNLLRKGIVVVAATGNNSRYTPNPVSFPACLPNVVAVAATHNGKVEDYSNTRGGFDFWAQGRSLNYNNRETVVGTSFAAPFVAGAFTILKQAKPNAIPSQMINVLKKHGKILTDSRTGSSGYLIDKSIVQEAANELSKNNDTFVPPIDSIPFIYQSAKKYRRIKDIKYTINIPVTFENKNLSPIDKNANLASSNKNKDINFPFGRFRISFEAARLQAYEVFLKINGKSFQRLKPSKYRGFTPLWTDYAFEFDGSEYLKPGKNYIKFDHISFDDWSIRNLKLESIPPPVIQLSINKKDSGSYGRGFGTNEHISGMTIEFTNPGHDLLFSLTGWDIDTNTESRIKLNNKILGFQRQACSSCYNGGTTFPIRKTDMQRGKNRIVIEQNSDNQFQNAKWGVKDLHLRKPPVINLTVGNKSTRRYGYGYGSNQHPSELQINFANPDSDIIFSMTGYDIDTTNESRVYLNGKPLGHQPKSTNNKHNQGHYFKIDRSQLQKGNNNIKFIQRNPGNGWRGFNAEKWGVTNLLIKKDHSKKLSPIIYLLLEDDK